MEDEDLDISLAINNETIYNSVIEDKDKDGTVWYFRNQFDGGSSSTKYSKKAMYNVLLDVRGNKIGQLSNKGAIVSNLIQEMPYKLKKGEGDIEYRSIGQFRSVAEKKINLKYMERRAKIEVNYVKEEKQQKMNELDRIINKEVNKIIKEKQETIDKLIEMGVAWDYTQLTDGEIKNFIMRNFRHFKKYSYYLLYLQMVAIDQPKTNLKVEQWMTKPLNRGIGRKPKKPRYIFHAKYKQANQKVKYSDCRDSNTLLCNFAREINHELGKKAREMEEDNYNNKPLFKALDVKDIEANDDCISTLKLLEDEYHIKRSEVPEIEELKEARKEREALGHFTDIRAKEEKLKEIRNSNGMGEKAKEDRIKEIYKEKRKLEEERESNKVALGDLEWKMNNLNNVITQEFTKIDLYIAEKFKNDVQAIYDEKVILKSFVSVRRKDSSDNTIKASCRFILNFAFAELEKELIENKKGVGKMYKEDKDGEIKYLNTNYKIVPVELVSLDLDRKETLKKKENLGILKKTRAGITAEVETIEGTIILKEEGKNINLYVADEKIGYVYPDFKEAVLGLKTIEVKEIEMGKNNKSASIYF